MTTRLRDLLEQRSGEQFQLHERYLNTQLVNVLRTIGFDRNYVRAEGPYLYDQDGNRYLDLLSGFGVFATGRNPPVVVQALRDVREMVEAGQADELKTMLRAAAKNFQYVTVIVDPADYPQVISEIEAHGNTTLATRFRLAVKVFQLTSKYDTAIAAWLAKVDTATNPHFKGE